MPVHARKIRRSTHLSSVLGGVALGVTECLVALGSPTAFDVTNVSSLWLALAFATGTQARTARQAAVEGAVCMPAALTGYYYSYMHFAEHQAGPYHLVHLAGRWLTGALVAAAVFAILGGAWADGRSRIAALCLAAAFLLEPLATVIHTQPVVRDVELALGTVVLAVPLAWKPRPAR
jgi:hypothetical protein